MTNPNEGNSTVGSDSPATMYAILKSNVGIAQEASLTGAFSEGAKPLIDAYNRIIRRLREMGTLDEGLFEEASSDINMDEIGVLSKHLASFFEVKYGCGRGSKFRGEEGCEGFGEGSEADWAHEILSAEGVTGTVKMNRIEARERELSAEKSS